LTEHYLTDKRQYSKIFEKITQLN